MFVDKLSARIVIFRHYLEVYEQDFSTLSWSEVEFNNLLMRKSIMNYLSKNIIDITKPLFIDNELQTLIQIFSENYHLSFKLDKESICKIANRLNHERNLLNSRFGNFSDKFQNVENNFLLLQFEDFKNRKSEFDYALRDLFIEKKSYIDTLFNIVWLFVITRYILQERFPNESIETAYEYIGIEMGDDEMVITHNKTLSIYFEKLNQQYHKFSKNLSEQFVRQKYPELLNEIAKTLHSSRTIFVSKRKYESIMKKVGQQSLHIELLLTAYDGYDFDVSREIVQKIIPTLL